MGRRSGSAAFARHSMSGHGKNAELLTKGSRHAFSGSAHKLRRNNRWCATSHDGLGMNVTGNRGKWKHILHCWKQSLKAAVAGGNPTSQQEVMNENRSRYRALVETKPEMARNAVRNKQQYLVRDRNRTEGSEAWDSDIKEVAVARLQQQIVSMYFLKARSLAS